jgi:ferredoxin-NADP reductase
VTVSQLLFYIVAGLLAQVLLGGAIAVFRARRSTDDQVPASLPIPARASSSAWIGVRAFRVARKEIEDNSQTQCSFYLEPVDGQPLPIYKPGQFLTFSLTSESESTANAASEITRCYSLSDTPHPAHYRVTIKRVAPPLKQPTVPPGKSSSYFHDKVQVGDILQVRAPSGKFYLNLDSQVPVVLIGGGIGVTPMISMLRWCLKNQPQRLVHLYYGVRNSAEHAFKSVLQELAANVPQFHLHVVYSCATEADRPGVDYHHTGHINMALLRQTLPHGQHQFYVCGPAAMMETLVPALAAWGVALSDIHFEAFGPASVHLTDPNSPAAQIGSLVSPSSIEIQFKRSERSLAWDNRASNLLDFAESHGIAVESGCRSGSCGSCATPLLSGEVLYEHTPDFELAPDQCLMCVGKPASALVLGV